MSDKLNLIVIVADTFRFDHIGCYGSEHVKTPHLDRLASEGVTFTNCYADDLPTIPERRVFFTGKSIIPEHVHGGWRPLRPDDVILPTVMRNNGLRTAFIADTYHYFKPDLNFHRDFDEWEFIRGQEHDMWKSGPTEDFDPKDYMPEHHWNDGGEHGISYDWGMRQYLMNTQYIRGEDDYFCARTLKAASHWLERNRNGQPFFLYIDTFDPHEPWDAPKRFQDMYYDNYPCERTMFGYGINDADIRPEDHDWIRALYAAECTFVDERIGMFLQRIHDMGMDDNTVIVFTTDHGTHLGEVGHHFQKKDFLLNSLVAQLPLIVRHPDRRYAGQKVDALVSSIDFMPTFLDFVSAENQPEMDGVNFWDLVTGKKESIHDRVFIEFRNFAAVRDLKWHYYQGKYADNPGYGPCLYDLENDRAETTNVADKHPEVIAELKKILAERLSMALP